MCFRRVLLAFSGLFLVSLAWAQDVSSGPDQGKKVPPLKVFDATGPNKDKEIDYAAERRAKPTIYIFIQADKMGPSHGPVLAQAGRGVAEGRRG
jgi:hypothetical protein